MPANEWLWENGDSILLEDGSGNLLLEAGPFWLTALSELVTQGGGSVPWPPIHAADDIGILVAETANEAVTLSTPAGFVECPWSPVFIGTTGDAAATRLHFWWKRATTNPESTPVIADPGDHLTAKMYVFRGCVRHGDPWNSYNSEAVVSTTAVDINCGIPTVPNSLVVGFVSWATDTLSSELNDLLTGDNPEYIFLRTGPPIDIANSLGNGGGFACVFGVLETPDGSEHDLIGTLDNASAQALAGFALTPADQDDGVTVAPLLVGVGLPVSSVAAGAVSLGQAAVPLSFNLPATSATISQVLAQLALALELGMPVSTLVAGTTTAQQLALALQMGLPASSLTAGAVSALQNALAVLVALPATTATAGAVTATQAALALVLGLPSTSVVMGATAAAQAALGLVLTLPATSVTMGAAVALQNALGLLLGLGVTTVGTPPQEVNQAPLALAVGLPATSLTTGPAVAAQAALALALGLPVSSLTAGPVSVVQTPLGLVLVLGETTVIALGPAPLIPFGKVVVVSLDPSARAVALDASGIAAALDSSSLVAAIAGGPSLIGV